MAESHGGAPEHGAHTDAEGGNGGFLPFDSSTFASQLVSLVIAFVALYVIVFAVVAFLALIPLAALVVGSLRDTSPGVPGQWTLANWANLVSPGVIDTLLTTLIVAGLSTSFAMVMGTALGIMFLSWRIMPRTISGRVLTRSQAVAIVDGSPVGAVPQVAIGYGIYVGLIASIVLVAFGLTIVVKRASRPYVVSDVDDDV